MWSLILPDSRQADIKRLLACASCNDRHFDRLWSQRFIARVLCRRIDLEERTCEQALPPSHPLPTCPPLPLLEALCYVHA